MKPSIASLALAALLAVPVWAPASIPSGDVLSALSPAPAPSADLPAVAFLSEIRGPATLSRTCGRLGLPLPLAFVPEEAPIRDFLLDRNPTLATVDFDDAPDGANILSLDPASRDAFFALFADNGWSNETDTPEGYQVFASPSGAIREYVADLDSKLLVSTSPAHLAAACALYPSLPSPLPAEGDAVVQLPASALARACPAEARDFLSANLSSLTAGLGLDGDTAALQAVVAPVPGAPLADLSRALGPIPPATACVNLPGALAFFAEGPCPDLRDLFPDAFDDDPVTAALERHTANQPASFAFFPPATPGRPRALAYVGLNDPAALRAALLDRLSRRADAIAVATDSSHRDIPVDTLSIANPDALQDLLATQFGPNPQYALIPYIQQTLDPTLSLAWPPDALLVAFNDADSALLHPALDSLLDGDLSALQFESSPAFQSAFPYPDAPAHALAHLDLDALLAAYAVDLPLALPAPCPLDFFAYIAPDASLVLRLRAPANLVSTLTCLASSIPGGAGGPPAESEDTGDPPATKTPNP